MATTVTGQMARTLGDWGAFFQLNGKPYGIINLMDVSNSILDDIMWREATDYDGHRTAVRDGLPQVYWRRLYRGTPPSKSSVSIIKDPVGMLEARCIIDAKMFELHTDQKQAYRTSEASAFMEAMRQEMATALFYGNIKGNPDGIHGLDPRYAFNDAPQVLDAGGTGDCTSIWGVVWGENDVVGIFPKGSTAGLSHKDLGESDVYDENGNAYRAISDLYSWHVGLSVRDWRSVVRICNIPVQDLEKAKGDAGFIDLHRLCIKAKNLVPSEKRMRMKWYVNQPVMTALEFQATDAGNVNLNYRQENARSGGPLFKSHSIKELHGCDVRQCDAILSTEKPLVATIV